MHILVVDDDPLNCKLVKYILGEEGYDVAAVGSTEAVFAHLQSKQPDLFILDVRLPHPGGLELCRRLRNTNPNAVILFLTAKGELRDRISGLETGGDDYLIKPFEPAELVARVKALMRRYQRVQDAPYTAQLRSGNVELHVSDLEVIVGHATGARVVSLTPTEMKLLRCLMVSADRVVSRDTLLDSIWGFGKSASDGQAIDVYIRRLRKKIEADPSDPKLIESIRGSGYRFNGAAVDESAVIKSTNPAIETLPSDVRLPAGGESQHLPVRQASHGVGMPASAGSWRAG